MKRRLYHYPATLGGIYMADDGSALTHLGYLSTEKRPASTNFIMGETSLMREAKRQLEEYLAGGRTLFTIPLAPKGTPFQMCVWEALSKIPYGETRSYKQLAEAVQSPKAFRAVGMANHQNPISILIPCHRVIGANGRLTGYAGGLDVKGFLLQLEATVVTSSSPSALGKNPAST